MTSWPTLPPRAAYLALDNATRRNALSLSILRGLRTQLHTYNTSPVDGRLLLLPPFTPSLLSTLEGAAALAAARTTTTVNSHDQTDSNADRYSWLVSATHWRASRQGLPNIIVLRSSAGPVFCSGHDLAELQSLSHDEVKETFALCAEVMTLIRRCPVPVVCVVQGLATAAGAQLALTADLTIAKAGTLFRLPGAGLGLPCTSPATAVGRRLGVGVTGRMLVTGEGVRVEEMGGGVDVVHVGGDGVGGEAAGDDDDAALEERVRQVVKLLAERTAPQPQALGKWAFWTQMGMDGRGKGGGDGYEEAVEWTGRVMALHARSEDAREGMASFVEKRRPEWKL